MRYGTDTNDVGKTLYMNATLTDKDTSVEVPDNLQRYFWDYDVARLSGDQGRNTVVTRLLQVGGWDAVKWLLTNVGDDALRTLLTKRRGRGIDPKRLRFWGVVLDLPREDVDAWVRSKQTNPWYNRVAR